MVYRFYLINIYLVKCVIETYFSFIFKESSLVFITPLQYIVFESVEAYRINNNHEKGSNIFRFWRKKQEM